jgi:predicted TIM-barrel fold metal-dependent hydrolase
MDLRRRIHAPFDDLGIDIVDAHVNVGVFEGLELTAPSLCDRMRETSVRSAVVCSLDALCRRERKGNDDLARLQRTHAGTLFGLATVHPSDPPTLLDRAFSDGLVGLKLNPRLQNFDPVVARLDALLDICRSYDRPVMIHCGMARPATHPEALARIARRHPRVRFVFAHIGGTNTHLTVEEIASLDNVFVETSVSRHVYDPILRAVRRLGASRVMFGSDAPFGSLSIELYRVLASGLTDGELGEVLGASARRVFRL